MDPYEELQQKYEELQRQYNEMRELLQQTARAMEVLAKPKRKSRSTAKLTLLKGGLGGLVAWLLWLLRRALRHPALSGTLTACVVTVATVVIWGAMSGPAHARTPGALGLLPPATSQLHPYKQSTARPHRTNGGVPAPGALGPVQTITHGHNPVPSPAPSGSPPPGPQPCTPTHRRSCSHPPHPNPAPSHTSGPGGRHCIIKINALGIKVKVCT